jgi:BirA family biotin operon repressor/biotin-[acetyl-CoA-carboxylase] ligase
LLDILLEEIDSRRALLDDQRGRGALRDEYLRALATIDQQVRVEQSDHVVEGLAVGVDHEGRLLVEVEGEVQTFAVGDVVHVRAHEDHR